jgi:hypothetical protein
MQMKSMRSVSTIILVGMWLGGVSACAPLMMKTPVSKTADGWALTLSEVTVGPDEYIGEGGVLVEAGDNQKLVWTLLTVKNQGSEEQTFSYEACILNGPGQASRPSVIDRNEEIHTAVDRAEAFNPGQERTRKVIYNFPKDVRPTSMKYENIVLPIKFPK